MKKSVGWGKPVPNDPEHTIYDWIAALTNYLTVLGGTNALAASTAAEGQLLPRLADREGAEDLEVDAGHACRSDDHLGRSGRRRRHQRRRRADALLRAARVLTGRRRRLHLRIATAAL